MTAAHAPAPSAALRLYGTEEPVEAPRHLVAGPLAAELEDGNLRYVRFHGREMIRAVSFIVRDRNWGTYRPRIAGLTVKSDATRFLVAYEAETGDAAQRFAYRARIEGRADGTLVFEAEGEALGDFTTNRTGFVVLHPIDGVAGAPCTVEHVDGRIVETRFPELIDPVQPMMDLRALTHAFAPGHRVTCRMEGDTFEMEDQRNWTDASYKTYVRPLALPWPYVLRPVESLSQRVTLSVEAPAGAALPAPDRAVRIALAPAGRLAPAIGFGLDPADAAATRAATDRLRAAGPRHVVCAYDPALGHDDAALAAAVEAARAVGGEPWLEAVIRRVEGWEHEVATLGRSARALGSPFTTVLVSPGPDLKCTLPGSPWPPCPPLDALYRATREAFPGVRIGGGMFSYFTELNRKRPPLEQLDLVTFTSSPLVHAGDDRSVAESLEALPAVFASARAIAGDRPLHVGPSAIGMRGNPYGAAPMENPDDVRQAMNRVDPRQRGLFGAAFALGYYARCAEGGVAEVTLGGGVGAFGIVHAPMPYAQPWWDARGGGLFPAFHAMRALAGIAGRPLIAATSSLPRSVLAVGAETDGGHTLLLANLTDGTQEIGLWAPVEGRLAVLDEDAVVAAADDPDAFAALARSFSGAALTLPRWAMARLQI